jgi:hypothetical protein
MLLDEYTPENVCRAMGLPSFAEDRSLQETGEALRIVFLPSFDPEVSITFRPAESGLAVQVVALKRMLWHERMWCRLPETSSGPFKVAAPNYAALLEGLTDAKTSLATGQRDRFVILDGMTIAACSYSPNSTIVLEENTSATDAIFAFSTLVVKAAWAGITSPAVANSLSAVARYVDMTYPIVELPPEPPITRLLILGTPDDRKDYFELLRHRDGNKA